MLKNWYIAIFAILLAGAGMGFVPFSVPNQEIVVQFTETVSEDEAAKAVAQVKEQLLSLGVEDLKITQQSNGYLKITYYSDVAIAEIQAIFGDKTGFLSGFQKNALDNNSNDLPFQKAMDGYTFTVSEIGESKGFNSGLKGLVLEVDSKSNRFYPPDFSFSGATITEENQLLFTKTSIILSGQLTAVIGLAPRLLPETRAGPIS